MGVCSQVKFQGKMPSLPDSQNLGQNFYALELNQCACQISNVCHKYKPKETV